MYITQMSRVQKQQVKKKETIVEILPSCPLLYLYWYMSREKQGVVFFFLPSEKRFFSDPKTGTSSATFSVVV